MSTMRSWFFGSSAHTSPQSNRSRKRARVGLSIDSDSSDGDELPDIMFRTIGRAQRERGMSDRSSANTVSAKAAPTTWALDWTMTDSSDDDSIQRRRSMSEPHVYGDDYSSMDDEAPFLPSPSDLLRRGSGGTTSPSPFLLPAPRRLLYPEMTVYQHNHNATHTNNNNHGRGTRRRTRTTEEHGRHEFWRSASLDSDDEPELFVDTNTSNTISSSPPLSPTRNRRGTRKFWTPYRLLMVLFLFATYTTFWLPIPAAPQATYSLRGSRISLDHASSASTASVSTPTTLTATPANQSRPLPTLDDSHQRGGLRMTGGGKGSSNNNNLILARPSGTASLAYRNSESLQRYYQQQAFHHESDVFFRWSWYCNVVVLSMFVVAAGREYKNRGQAVCDL
jgi:hypothetical protein